MASNYTSNYNLCQWEADDKVLRTEFNEDNRKIDAALRALASSVSGKASSSALSALQTTVNGLKTSKADQSDLNSLKTTVTQHTSALAGKGNCQFYTTTYVGDGQTGSSGQTSLIFSKKPMLVLISSGSEIMMLVQGSGGSFVHAVAGGGAHVTVGWSGNSVSWYSSDVSSQMSFKNRTYQVLALLKAD